MWVNYQEISNCCRPVLTYWLTDWRHQWLTDCWLCMAFCRDRFSLLRKLCTVGYGIFYMANVPSVLWHCWLGVTKSIQPVKIEWWGACVVISLERGAECLHMVQLMPLHPETPSSLASFKSREISPFYTVSQKKQDTKLLPITFPNIGRFSKFFHC